MSIQGEFRSTFEARVRFHCAAVHRSRPPARVRPRAHAAHPGTSCNGPPRRQPTRSRSAAATREVRRWRRHQRLADGRHLSLLLRDAGQWHNHHDPGAPRHPRHGDGARPAVSHVLGADRQRGGRFPPSWCSSPRRTPNTRSSASARGWPKVGISVNENTASTSPARCACPMASTVTPWSSRRTKPCPSAARAPGAADAGEPSARHGGREREFRASDGHRGGIPGAHLVRGNRHRPDSDRRPGHALGPERDARLGRIALRLRDAVRPDVRRRLPRGCAPVGEAGRDVPPRRAPTTRPETACACGRRGRAERGPGITFAERDRTQVIPFRAGDHAHATGATAYLTVPGFSRSRPDRSRPWVSARTSRAGQLHACRASATRHQARIHEEPSPRLPARFADGLTDEAAITAAMETASRAEVERFLGRARLLGEHLDESVLTTDIAGVSRVTIRGSARANSPTPETAGRLPRRRPRRRDLTPFPSMPKPFAPDSCRSRASTRRLARNGYPVEALSAPGGPMGHVPARSPAHPHVVDAGESVALAVRAPDSAGALAQKGSSA